MLACTHAHLHSRSPTLTRAPLHSPLLTLARARLQVGHTGVYDAAVAAISATDAAVGTIAAAASSSNYVLLITADHGNAEQMINPSTGAPHTAHTTNPVPFIVKGPEGSEKGKRWRWLSDEEAGKGEKKGETDEGALCDVAPTILDIMVSVLLGLDRVLAD